LQHQPARPKCNGFSLKWGNAGSNQISSHSQQKPVVPPTKPALPKLIVGRRPLPVFRQLLQDDCILYNMQSLKSNT
jgi:hypothetical protein